MRNLLTFADYFSTDWGSIEIADDESSHRAFWTAVLQFAAADGATEIHYDLDKGSECLSIVIDGEGYAMEPPPSEFRVDLLTAAHRLATGSFFCLVFRRFLNLIRRDDIIGQILLEVPDGKIAWAVIDQRQGVRIERLPS